MPTSPDYRQFFNPNLREPTGGEGIELAASFFPPTAVMLSVDKMTKKQWEEAFGFLLDAMIGKTSSVIGKNLMKRFGNKGTKGVIEHTRGIDSSAENYTGPALKRISDMTEQYKSIQ